MTEIIDVCVRQPEVCVCVCVCVVTVLFISE